MKGSVKLSIIIPAKDEEKNVGPLLKEIVGVLKNLGQKYEIIFVEDGSTDNTFANLVSLKKRNRGVKIIKLRGNWGKSAALQIGFNHAQGSIIITMDADLQDDPIEIPRFIQKIDEGYDLVSGWKKRRRDPIHTVVFSRFAHLILASLTGVRLHDLNCGFKAYKKEVAKSLNLYGELYRFIPLFVSKQNYKVTEIAVAHRSRKYGKSKYGLTKNVKGLLDLITVFFLTGYLRRPGHFFGSLGIFSFGSGFVIGLYITYLRIATGSIQNRHPLLFLGMLLMIVGIQLFTTGLVAELIVSLNKDKDTTKIIVKKS